MTLRLAVLVSGRGTNLGAILDAVEAGSLDADVRVVISNRPGAPALARAEAAGVQNVVVDHQRFENRLAFDRAVLDVLRENEADWIVLAGFMRLLTPEFIGAFRERIVNVHPSLLPAFPGMKAQAQAVEYGAKVTGCTVHFVDEGTDTGPIIAQAPLTIHPEESVQQLSERLLKLEHELLVDSLQAIAEGRVTLRSVNGRPRATVVAELNSPEREPTP